MAVAGDGRPDLLLDPVAIEDAALADEEIAVISIGALPREGERDFDDVRGLDRAGGGLSPSPKRSITMELKTIEI